MEAALPASISINAAVEPTDGLNVWVRFPGIEDSLALTNRAAREGLVLAPGSSFSPQLDQSPWMRFNVALSDNPPRAPLVRADIDRE